MKSYILLKEKALVNIDLLFNYWKLSYTKINNEEYDFISPIREDNNFGACRFNSIKGIGSDFAGSAFDNNDFNNIGLGFNKEDFNSIIDGKIINSGFDIIGLTQRLHGCTSYKQAAELLNKQLEDISKNKTLNGVDLSSAVKRQYEIEQEREKRVKIAIRTWNLCLPIHKTLGETYLNSRMIFLEQQEPTIKYHPKVYNRETNSLLPSILMKCTQLPDAPLRAIHRIYLSPTGMKANLNTIKLALGTVKGLGIWFNSYTGLENLSTSRPQLCIAEGPENALTIRSLGYNFVVSTINASNFGNITIPETVKEILLFPDAGESGKRAADKAAYNYGKVLSNIKVIFPPKNPDNPKWDWNDELMLRGKNVRERGK